MLTCLLVFTGGLLAGVWGAVWGITPVIAAVLIAACFLKKRDVFLIAIGSMLLRDVLMGFGPMTGVRILAVLGVAGTAMLFRTRFHIGSLLLSLLVAAPVFHFIITVGAWAVGACMGFPITWAGFTESIVTTVPYFLNSLAGQFLYTAAFLGVYALTGAGVRKWWPVLLTSARRI